MRRALSRIEDQNTPEAALSLRRIASECLSRDRIQGETTAERRQAVSEAGRRALLALARRNDPKALEILEAIQQGEKVLFDETHVFQTVALVLLKGDYGFEGQHVLEKFLHDQSYLLPEGDDILEAVLKYRSGLLILKLVSKNPWLDRSLNGSTLRKARFHVSVFHLHLLESVAREGRAGTLRWLLRHPDLLRAVREAPPGAKGRAVQSLISVYHQTAGEGDRETVADLMEETGHEFAVAFFRGEILRLRHTRSLRGLVQSVLGVGPDRRALLEARIDRMRARRVFRSA